VAALLEEERIEAVMHLAAGSHVDRSILAPAAFIETNVLGTQVLLDAARKAGVQRFLHVSTDEVYSSLAARTSNPQSASGSFITRRHDAGTDAG